jgi:CRP-like cAMP-binding protein
MSEPSTNREKLPNIGPIGVLSEETRSKLAHVGRFETLATGEYLAVQGEPHSTLAVILKGHPFVFCHAHGDKIDLATLNPGETVGEMSLIDPQPASASVIVREGPVEIWAIEQAEFEQLVEADPRLGYEILNALAKELCFRLRRNSETMLSKASEQRNRFRDLDY